MSRVIRKSKLNSFKIHLTSITRFSRSSFSVYTQRSWDSFSSVDPWLLSRDNPHEVLNLVNGKWTKSRETINVVDPINGENFLRVQDAKVDEIEEFVKSLNSCSKSG